MKLAYAILIVIVLQGCTFRAAKNSMIHAYPGVQKPLGELSLISGEVRLAPPISLGQVIVGAVSMGIHEPRPDEQIDICGANGVVDEGYFDVAVQSVLVPPGKQELCIRVARGLSATKSDNKIISFETEADKSYTIKFEYTQVGFTSKRYFWVEDSEGNHIESHIKK